jgi:hypothetical protein
VVKKMSSATVCDLSRRVVVKNISDARAFSSDARYGFMVALYIVSMFILLSCLGIYGYYKQMGLKRLAIRSRTMILLNLVPVLLYLNSNVLFGIVGAFNYPW